MTIEFPNIKVEVNYYDNYICSYSLIVNGNHEGTYATKDDLQFRIALLINTELNRGLSSC